MESSGVVGAEDMSSGCLMNGEGGSCVEASDESGAVLSESHLDCASGVEDLLEVVGKVTDAGSGS